RGDDRLALLTACAYSVSKSMIFGALLNGAALMMFDIKKRGVAGLADWLIGEEVTVYHSVPTVLRHFARTLSGGVRFPKLRLLHLSGEPLLARDIALAKGHVPPTCRFANELGTTETHVSRLYIADVQSERADGAVPVGYPVEDTEILLLDEAGAEVGLGGSGEIAVKSRYVSPGYWRRPELTRAAFQPAPGGGSERIY